MTSGRTSRTKGRRWQTAVRQWLEHAGYTTHERPGGLTGDDLTIYADGLPISIECKDQQRLDLAGWTDQAVQQAPPDAIPIVIAHRRGRASPADGYIILRAADMLRLLEGLTR